MGDIVTDRDMSRLGHGHRSVTDVTLPFSGSHGITVTQGETFDLVPMPIDIWVVSMGRGKSFG